MRPHLLLALLALAGCKAEECIPPRGAGRGAAAGPGAAVHLAPATEARAFTGVVRARREADIAFRTGGRITARLVEVGQSVATGQLLARLDEADLALGVRAAEAELSAAEAQSRQATAEAARSKTLLAAGHVAAAYDDQRVAAARSAAEKAAAARAGLDLARRRLDYAQLRAPNAGVVTALLAEAGQVVAEGQAMLRIANPEERELVVQVPESTVGGLAEAAAEARFWARPDEPHAARLRELAPQAEDRAADLYRPLLPSRGARLGGARHDRHGAHAGANGDPRHTAALGAARPRPGTDGVEGGARPRRRGAGRGGLARRGHRRAARRAGRGRSGGGARPAGAGPDQPGPRRRPPSRRHAALRATGMRFNLSDWGVRNGTLTLFLILLLAAAGGFSYLRLGRAEDPGFTIKVMVVSAQWPGATAAEMQDQVADRIESRLQDLPHLDYVQTFTRPGSAITTVVLQDTTPPREVQGLWYQVRKKVGDIQRTLPAGVQGPFFDDEYSDVYAVVIALTGADNAELVRQAERLRLRFLALPGAGKVTLFGEEAQRVFVDVSHARLATLAVPPGAIIDALARHNSHRPFRRRGDRLLPHLSPHRYRL
ncbi:efflux RND transporter periplasmic adaptor subunit [Dankookia sp. P2]|uniref:efflux RND transporter periplasmic adaptor subunit n=1 Tax=Dankookia sp. P2 TaxID=3423955 RepID=UPI003D675A69